MRITTIFVIFIAALLLGCNSGKKEIIVVPENFKGYIFIIFDQKNGQPKTYEGGNRVYEVPQSGILKTQFSADYDWRDLPVFYYHQVDEKNKLASYLEIEKVPGNQVAALMGSNGSANRDLAGKETVSFSKFYVGTKSEIEKFKEQAEKLDIVKLVE